MGGVKMEKTEKSARNEKLYLLFQKLGGQYPSHGTIFLPEHERNEELKKIFEVFLENRKTDDALETAKLLVEPHRTEAIIKVIYSGLLRWTDDVLKMMDILSEPQRTTVLVKYIEQCHEDGMFSAVRKVADMLSEPQRTDELAKIIEKHISKGQIDAARLAAKMILKNHQG